MPTIDGPRRQIVVFLIHGVKSVQMFNRSHLMLPFLYLAITPGKSATVLVFPDRVDYTLNV
jgi:hypothetical protein